MITIDFEGVNPPQIYPDRNWLYDEAQKEPHFAVLRSYYEVCWLWNTFLYYKEHRPDKFMVWDGGITVKARAFETFVEKRSLALKTAFFLLTQAQLNELRTLSSLTPIQEHVRDDLLFWTERRHITEDIHGQSLPNTLGQILKTIEQAPPFKNQGLCGLTKKIKIGKQLYFAKLTDVTMLGVPPLGEDDFNEVTTQAALRALNSQIAAKEAYHIVSADGRHCSLVSAHPGKTFTARSSKRLASLVRNDILQWIVLAEWLFGMQDRNPGNLVIDESTGNVGVIDCTYGWAFLNEFLNWDDPQDLRNRVKESFARELWELQDPDPKFDPYIISTALGRKEAIFNALAPFNLPKETLEALSPRFDVLEHTITSYDTNVPISPRAIAYSRQIDSNEKMRRNEVV